MTTMNRIYCIYKESYQSAHLEKVELGLSVIPSSVDKHIRRHCIIDAGL